MIRKLLLAQQKPLQLFITWLGAFTGFFILLFALQYYLDFDELLNKKNDWLHPEYIVVNKKISLLSTFNQDGNAFSNEELEELKAFPGVEQIGLFKSNLFKASGTILQNNSSAEPVNLYAELFFEAVPNEFVDVKNEEWQWEEGDELIPIIVPADYLKLYNFGFAPSQKLPQISEKTVEAFTFRVYIDSLGRRLSFPGKIVGFSDRLNSILVPLNFLEYANKQFAPHREQLQPSRVVLVVKDPQNPALLRFLEDKAYEANSEQLRNARLNNVLRVMIGLVSAIGLVIIFLAILGWVQYAQLALHRSSYEVKTLIELGYKPGYLFLQYFKWSMVLLGSIVVCSIALLMLVKNVADAQIAQYGFELSTGLRAEIIPEAVLIFISFAAIQSWSLYRGIVQLARPRT